VIFGKLQRNLQTPYKGTPRCKTQICIKLYRSCSTLSTMIFGAYFTGHKLKLPPAATPKVGSKKFDGPKTHQIDWEWSQNASLKAISTLDKNEFFRILLLDRFKSCERILVFSDIRCVVENCPKVMISVLFQRQGVEGSSPAEVAAYYEALEEQIHRWAKAKISFSPKSWSLWNTLFWFLIAEYVHTVLGENVFGFFDAAGMGE